MAMMIMAVNAQAGTESQGSASSQQQSAQTADVSHGQLKVLSFNMRQWTRDVDSKSATFWRTRMEAMRRMIEDIEPDVICLQEFMAPVGQYIPDGYKRVGATLSHPIFVRDGLETSKHSVSVFWEACMVGDVQIINVHSRWETEVISRTVAAVRERALGVPTIACGDFNNSLATIRKHGMKMTSAREILGIPEVDTFANFTKDTSHGAIDHFFVKGVTPVTYLMVTEPYGEAPAGTTGTFKMSDHYPIYLEVEW